MKFKNYTENRERHIERYVAYLADKHGESLEEAARRSLARIWQQMSDGQNHAIITAFRGENKLPQNRNRNMALISDMRELGWGFTPVSGGFREKVQDLEGQPTGEERDVDEESFFVTGNDDSTVFKKQLLALAQKYNQDAVIVKYHDDPTAHMLDVDGSEEALGQWKKDDLAQYYTKMKKGPENRKFTFESAGDLTRSTLMAIDIMFND
jgi:hypothetical protein